MFGIRGLSFSWKRGRSEGPYAMCLEHADHNCRNRDAQLLETTNDELRRRYQR